MSQDPAEVERALTVRWTGVEEIPIHTANQFLVQVDAIGDRPDQLVLAVGQVTPPPVLGTDQEKLEQMRTLEYVQVLPLARYSITPGRLRELIDLLDKVQRVWSPSDNSTGAGTNDDTGQ